MHEQGKVSLTYDEASKISGKLKRILKTVKYRGRLEETKDGKLCIDSFINYLEGKSPFVPRAERVLSTDAQALRQETQRRLEEVSGQREVLTGRDLHYIFGINLASGPSIMAKKPWMQEYAFKNERGLLCFKKEGVRKMFDYGRITSGAWEFPKAGAD